MVTQTRALAPLETTRSAFARLDPREVNADAQQPADAPPTLWAGKMQPLANFEFNQPLLLPTTSERAVSMSTLIPSVWR